MDVVGRWRVVRKRAVVLGLVLVAVMATGACGDDGDDSAGGGGGGGRLTQDELASRGDSVCNRLDAEVKELAGQFPQSITFPPDQMQELFQKLVPVVDRALADLEELEPPENLEAQFQEALDQADQDRQKLVTAGESSEAARALFEGNEDPFTATNEKLAAVGITACSDDAGVTQGDAGGTTDSTTTSAP